MDIDIDCSVIGCCSFVVGDAQDVEGKRAGELSVILWQITEGVRSGDGIDA